MKKWQISRMHFKNHNLSGSLYGVLRTKKNKKSGRLDVYKIEIVKKETNIFRI